MKKLEKTDSGKLCPLPFFIANQWLIISGGRHLLSLVTGSGTRASPREVTLSLSQELQELDAIQIA